MHSSDKNGPRYQPEQDYSTHEKIDNIKNLHTLISNADTEQTQKPGAFFTLAPSNGFK